jgi:hypothetical protein
MVRWLIGLAAVGLALGGAAPARADDSIAKLKITLYTDQDDKDDDEVVTIEIIHQKTKKVLASEKFGQGEKWKDQSEKVLDLKLKSPMPAADQGQYIIKVSKSCAQGYANGKGWHFCVRAVSGFDDKGDEYKIRGKETKRVLLGERSSEIDGVKKGPTSTDFDLAD